MNTFSVNNNHVWTKPLTSRGVAAWILGVILTGFYILLYFFPALLGKGGDGAPNTGIIALFDPLSYALKGKPASEWFLYGTLYTLAILGFGIKFIRKYRHNKYEILRTISVMFFQLGFAFLLPEILQKLNKPYYDFKNMWPLNYYMFDAYNLDAYLSSGTIGLMMLVWGLLMIFVISPILTYYFGKRWFCSWVCGCGGLAETAGDSFRHLSDKSLKAWKIERWIIHSVLIFVVIMTIGVLYSYVYDHPGKLTVTRNHLTAIFLVTLSLAGIFIGSNWFKGIQKVDRRKALIAIGIIIALVITAHLGHRKNILFVDNGLLRQWYGFFIGAIFSGVVGVGFYPILGSRVWCRYGCPMAAILGIQQKLFSRFRITTNGGQCISCGNCSTYCEMGIDVRAYAQKGENIVRASCVGCGVCSAVCPRGVLKLEGSAFDISDRVLVNE
ncbi:MAG TPA: 4Fe-4S binding protein [Saprospiraceae bacterium]|nr:4Fe-4S binding protein [Saprospiraceae bacterium]